MRVPLPAALRMMSRLRQPLPYLPQAVPLVFEVLRKAPRCAAIVQDGGA